MLRWMFLSCVALGYITLGCVTLVVADARAADQTAASKPKRHASANLPPGLPRPHYKARTTIVYGAPPPPVVVARDSDVLISIPTTPLLPGSSTLPGYYGRPFDYDYQGAYYGGGGYLPYFFREPYVCGVTGYC
jgi:hypothetical protein